jgi:hypothetical protein
MIINISNKIKILTGISLVMISMSALEASGCNIPEQNMCMEFIWNNAADKTNITCRKYSGVPFYTGSCPVKERVAACENTASSFKLVTWFYYPKWMLSDIQKKCAASGGVIKDL